MSLPRCSRVVAVLLAMLVPGVGLASAVTLPAGTVVYGELDQQVTSKKKDTEVGDIVRAHVWRNVLVDGRMVLRAGAPMVVRVANVKKAKFAGIKGKLELEAVSAQAVDGSEVLLDGGYDKSGHGRKALSISLAAVVAWPLIFIKGKQAVLDPGTVFDASVQADVPVAAQEAPVAKVKLGGGADLTVEVLYDRMDPEGKSKLLPVRLELCGAELHGASVVTVNDRDLEPTLPVALGAAHHEDRCTTVEGNVDLKALGKHFNRGINRFEIEAGGTRSEVILDIEL